MREVFFSVRFKKDVKRFRKSPREQNAILDVIELLRTANPPLPAKLREHTLSGEFSGCLECHALPDLLLIYTRTDAALTLLAAGSHAHLFG